MKAHRIMAGLLTGLVLLALWQRMGQAPASAWARLAWDGFLFWLPLILGGFLLAGARWALMAGIIYGTVGLALDISTFVQTLSQAETQTDLSGTLMVSSLTGLLNFLLILFGGRGFLDVTSVGKSTQSEGRTV